MQTITEEQIDADIETATDGYAARFSGAIGRWMLKRQSDITLGMLAAYPDEKVLDVGGGHAQLAIPLVENGFDVTVHGSAESCASRIQELLESNQCKFVRSSMFNLPFDDGAFETVLCFRLLTHCTEWETLVAELCRVAGKRIIIDYPSGRSLNTLVSGRIFAMKKKLEGNTRTWRLFSHREIREVFSRHGFTPTREVKQFFLPMALHRGLRSPKVSALLETICRTLGLTKLWGSPAIMMLEKSN